MAYLGVSPSNGVRKVHTYTATASQTTFSGAGAENISLSYRDSTYIDVYQNGVKLGDADYTATSGTSVVLGTGATASDLVVVVVYDVFSVADTVSKTDGGQFDGAVTFAGAFTSLGIDDNADANAITIDSSERVGIGETSPQTKLHIKTADASATADSNSAVVIEGTDATRADLQFLGDAGAFQAIYFGDNSDADIGRIAYDHTGNSMRINVNASERVRINDDGNVLIGRTSELTDFGDGRTSLVLQGTGSQDYSTIQLGNNGTASNTQILGLLGFFDGTNENARVQGQRGTSTDSADLLFFTRPASGSNTERMRILSGGDVCINDTASGTGSFSAPHLHVTCDASKNGVGVENHRQNYAAYVVQADNDTGSRFALYIINGSGLEAGKISYTSSSTTFATTSDYRLKENVKYDFDATSRLKQLKPCRFNFKIDTDNTVDGFLAHEVSSIVPEAILGEKDATKEDGSIAPQSIDQAKIVPLLTKALQEALTRIDTLEAEVKTLKGE